MEERTAVSVDAAITQGENGTIDVEGEWISPDVARAMAGDTVEMVSDIPDRTESEEE